MFDVYAACSGFTDCLKDISVPGLTGFSEQGLIGQIVSVILPAIIGIAGFITVIIIIISGIQFITSSGNPEAAAGARGRLTYALIGFVLILLAYGILQIINNIFLGTNVVT